MILPNPAKETVSFDGGIELNTSMVLKELANRRPMRNSVPMNWAKVDMPTNLSQDTIKDWASKNTSNGQFFLSNRYIFFENEIDAVYFQLAKNTLENINEFDL